ncbi:MAG: nucleotidyltransferase domain-containing protein [Clostridia bacterium]|nr:nucleotidyltransferase domain-containing protein [Clostridia bacterium]
MFEWESAMHNKTKERAWEIINIYLKAVEAVKSIKSIILVGSLSDDTYTGNVGSDIDLVHIIYDRYDYEKEKKNIKDLISKVERETNNDIPISQTIYSERHLLHPYNYNFDLSIDNKDLIERPIEIFRMLDSGKLLYGEDILSTLERPTMDDVQTSVELEQKQLKLLAKENSEWFSAYTEMRKRPTIRIMTQIVLTTALSDYYFCTGRSCSSKFKILELIEKEMPNLSYLNLLRLCHKNRFSPDEITEEDINTMNREYKVVFLKD